MKYFLIRSEDHVCIVAAFSRTDAVATYFKVKEETTPIQEVEEVFNMDLNLYSCEVIHPLKWMEDYTDG